MIPNYALEQLRSAVCHMACSNQTLQRRLEDAYEELEPLIVADFPRGLGDQYLEIISLLTSKGSIQETTAAISNDEASEAAALITKLFFSLEAATKAATVSQAR